MEIKAEEEVTVPDAKKILEERKKERDLVYEQKLCLDYIEKIPKVSLTQKAAMEKDLATITILKPRYVALIINNLPATEEDVEMLFAKERTNLKKEEVKQIAEIVKKHFK